MKKLDLIYDVFIALTYVPPEKEFLLVCVAKSNCERNYLVGVKQRHLFKKTDKKFLANNDVFEIEFKNSHFRIT